MDDYSTSPASPQTSSTNTSRRKVVCVCLNPAVEVVYLVGQYDEVNTAEAWSLAAGGKATNVGRILAATSPVELIYPRAPTPLGTLYDSLLSPTAMLSITALDGLIAELRISTVLVDPTDPNRMTIIRTNGAESEDSRQHVDSDLLAALSETVNAGDYIVLSGSLPAGWSTNLYTGAIELARSRNARSVVDASGELLTRCLEARPDIVKVNRWEAAQSLRMNTKDDVKRLAEAMVLRGAETAVVTDGPRTLALASRFSEDIAIEPAYVPPVSPVGAGDAFLAGLVGSMFDNPGGDPRHHLERAVDVARNALMVLESGLIHPTLPD